MPSRLYTLTSALTYSLQDFLGLPRPLGRGMAILVIEFVQEDAHMTIYTLVNVNAPVVATTSWWLHFSAPVVALKVKKIYTC